MKSNKITDINYPYFLTVMYDISDTLNTTSFIVSQ